jgi:4-amino-4-deoxy-L-arabinose transferase-like glycosyltransferase
MSRWLTVPRHIVPGALLLVLLLATFLRFWQLDALPPGLYHDEAYNGLDALMLLEGATFPQFYEGWELYAEDAHGQRPPVSTRIPVFFEGNYGREPLHVYLMALAIGLFGATPFAVRSVPAAAGVLAVLTTYLAAKALLPAPEKQNRRPLTSRFVPLMAAFIMAILYSALHFSRFGIRAMVFVPVEALAVYCFWRGLRAVEGQVVVPRRLNAASAWFVGAGFLLGLGLYTYAAARLFPLLFVGFVLFWFWREPQAFWHQWHHVALMAGVSLLTAAPLLLFFARYPYFFVFRIAYVANKGLGTVAGKPWLTWWSNVGRVVRGLFWQGEMHLRHNLPGRPYLDPIQALFFVLGMVRSLRRRGQLPHFFLLLWLLVMLLPSVLSGDAPHFGRLSGAAPAIAILVGIGLAWLWQTVISIQYAVNSKQTRSPSSTLPATDKRIPITDPESLVTGDLVLITDHRSPITGHWSLITTYWPLVIVILLSASAWLTTRDYFQRYASHPDLARDFYLADWHMGQYAAAQPSPTSLYLTPTQAEMATIYFALGGPERLRSYNGAGGLIPAGRPGVPALYLVRPSDKASLDYLSAFFPQGTVAAETDSFIPFHVPAQAPRLRAENGANVSWQGKIGLAGWSMRQEEEVLTVTLYWQVQTKMDHNYTAFVHLLHENGELAAQLDRPPAGYATANWRPGEVVVDRYLVPLPPDLRDGVYTLQTGFYYLPTMARLGEPAVLGEVEVAGQRNEG